MPTIYDRPRKRSYPFYYRVAEQMAMRKVSCFLMMFGLLDMLKQSARNAIRSSRRANVILPLMATLAAAMLHEEIWLVSHISHCKVQVTFSPSEQKSRTVKQQLSRASSVPKWDDRIGVTILKRWLPRDVCRHGPCQWRLTLKRRSPLQPSKCSSERGAGCTTRMCD